MRADLTSLYLQRSALKRLPAAIATATSLRNLSIKANLSFAILPEDIQLLASLTSLRQLNIDLPPASGTAPRVLRALRRALPLLHLK